MKRKRNDVPASADEERQALFEQRRAVEELRAQLAERVAAVREREDELRAAITDVRAGREPRVTLPAVPSTDDAARARALDERERALAAREAELRQTGANGEHAADATRSAELDERQRALERQAAALDARERDLVQRVDPDAARLAEIDERLVELRAAERAFLRTREELAARAEAVTAREHLVAQRERELQEREAGWGAGELSELEARLRRLETQRAASTPPGFSGGFRKLEEGGRRGSRA